MDAKTSLYLIISPVSWFGMQHMIVCSSSKFAVKKFSRNKLSFGCPSSRHGPKQEAPPLLLISKATPVVYGFEC